MHISLGRMVGLPVMVHSRQIGYVENAMLDAQRVRLAGLVIRRGIGAAKWADCKAILRLETRRVLLDSPPVRMAGRAQPEPGQVFLATGAYAGEVTDAFLDVRSLCVSALEVCQGPLYRLAGRRAYAAQFCPQGGGNVVAQELLSWAQLVKQLGEEDDG